MRQSERVYQALRDDILNWELSPGTVLGEVELSHRLDVSRTPIREALPRLIREGLVQNIPGRGAIVAEISMAGISQLFQMREALETYAVRLAARAADRSAFTTLREQLREMRDGLATEPHPVDDFAEHYDLIGRFDTAIDQATNNLYLQNALRDLRGHLVRLRRLARRNPERMRRAAEEHLELCAAICAGDEVAASEATAQHIRNSLENILAVLVRDVTHSTLVGTSGTDPTNIPSAYGTSAFGMTYAVDASSSDVSHRS